MSGLSKQEWNEYTNKITPIIKGIWDRENKKRSEDNMDILDQYFGDKWNSQLDTALFVKQQQMKIGEIHQTAIGYFPGFIDLGIGHESGLDIRKADNSVIIELKNKYNTCNSGSKQAVMDKLSKYKLSNPDTLCILGIINGKPGKKEPKKIIEHNGVEIIIWEGHEFLSYIYTYDGIDYTEEVMKLISSIISEK